MSLRSIILCSAMLGSATAVHAATEFPNGLVPADIVRDLVGGNIYRGLPEGFPQILVPADLDLRVIATLERSQFQQQIMMQSPAGRDELLDRLHAILTSQGWVDISPDPNLAGAPLQLCHNQHGQMTITMTAAAGGTRLQVSRLVLPPQLTLQQCTRQQETRGLAALYAWYNSQFPALTMPAAAVRPSNASLLRGISSSYSGNAVEIRRDGNLEVPASTAAEIHDHFAAQLRTQGWVADSQDAGEVSASSVWVKTLTPPAETAAVVVTITLSVVQGIDDYYGIDMKLRSPPQDGNGFASVVGVRF